MALGAMFRDRGDRALRAHAECMARCTDSRDLQRTDRAPSGSLIGEGNLWHTLGAGASPEPHVISVADAIRQKQMVKKSLVVSRYASVRGWVPCMHLHCGGYSRAGVKASNGNPRFSKFLARFLLTLKATPWSPAARRPGGKEKYRMEKLLVVIVVIIGTAMLLLWTVPAYFTTTH